VPAEVDHAGAPQDAADTEDQDQEQDRDQRGDLAATAAPSGTALRRPRVGRGHRARTTGTARSGTSGKTGASRASGAGPTRSTTGAGIATLWPVAALLGVPALWLLPRHCFPSSARSPV